MAATLPKAFSSGLGVKLPEEERRWANDAGYRYVKNLPFVQGVDFDGDCL